MQLAKPAYHVRDKVEDGNEYSADQKCDQNRAGKPSKSWHGFGDVGSRGGYAYEAGWKQDQRGVQHPPSAAPFPVRVSASVLVHLGAPREHASELNSTDIGTGTLDNPCNRIALTQRSAEALIGELPAEAEWVEWRTSNRRICRKARAGGRVPLHHIP